MVCRSGIEVNYNDPVPSLELFLNYLCDYDRHASVVKYKSVDRKIWQCSQAIEYYKLDGDVLSHGKV